MNQSHCLNEIFDELHITADKHTQIISFINKYNSFRSAESDDERIKLKNYEYRIGKFVYVEIHIALNIVFEIERFNEYFNDSTTHHEQALMTLLSYVRFTIDLDIAYKMRSNVSESLNSSENSKF